ncbi:hypothetical protein HDU91_002550 [Kappamyces sp. JEL0680]|nr:hypothetical protein HDU91_002550 [Kappamyces sp. JEL0680]
MPRDSNKIKKPPNAFFLYRKDKTSHIMDVLGIRNAESQDVKLKYQAAAYEKFLLFKQEHPDYIWPSPKSREKKAAQAQASGLGPSPLSGNAVVSPLSSGPLSAGSMTTNPLSDGYPQQKLPDYSLVSTATGTLKRAVKQDGRMGAGYVSVETESGTLKRIVKNPTASSIDSPMLFAQSPLQMQGFSTPQDPFYQQQQQSYFNQMNSNQDFFNQMNSLNPPPPMFGVSTGFPSPYGFDNSFMSQVLEQKNTDPSFDDWWDSLSIASTESNMSQSSARFNPY